MTQSIEYVVQVNATKAQAAIADLEKRFNGVDSIVARVDKGVINLERDIADLNAAIKAGGPNTARYRDELNRLTMALNGGGGIAGRGGRGGGSMNLGQAGLEASRAIEDLQYGFNGIVNNIPSLVMGLGGTAGVAGAFSLAAVGANQLIKYLGKEMPDAAAEGAKAAKADIESLNKSLEDMALELRSLASGESIRRLRAEALSAAAADEAQQAGAAFRERFGDVTPSFIKSQRALYEVSKTARDIVDAYDQAYAVGEKAAKAQAAFVKTIQIEQLRQLKDQEEIDEKRQKRGVGKGQNIELDGELELRAKANVWLAKMRDEAMEAGRKAREAEAKELAGAFREMDRERRDADREAAKSERERTRILEREAKERQKLREEEARNAARIAQQQGEFIAAASIQTSQIIADGIVAAAQGQEDAVANTIAALSQQAGGFITLKGGELLAAGIAGTALGNPAGPGQIAIGGALALAGIAVSTGGPAAVSALMGQSGQTNPTSATRDPGASPRSSGGGSGSGGPMIINVAYGAGGPLPEDLAREIARAVDSGDRRRGAA
jgi:hypothetical protein